MAIHKVENPHVSNVCVCQVSIRMDRLQLNFVVILYMYVYLIPKTSNCTLLSDAVSFIPNILTTPMLAGFTSTCCLELTRPGMLATTTKLSDESINPFRVKIGDPEALALCRHSFGDQF